MKPLQVLALGCLLVLAGAGCSNDRPDTTSAEYGAEDMERRTEAAFNDFKRTMGQRMEALEDRAAELKEDAKEAQAGAKAEVDQQLEKLDAEMEQLRYRLEGLEPAAEGAWEDTKAGFESAMNSVKRTLDDIETRLRG